MTGPVAPVIEVAKVSKWYGDVVAVNEVSFQVHPGVTVLLGPNGAGKSTLLHLIAGLAKCSDGEVKTLGEPVRNNPSLYHRVGFMPENESLYRFYTGRQFVRFAAKLHGLRPVDDHVDAAIRLVGMDNAQDRLLGGYSRGMRQRMRLAAAIVHDPEVMILDEPLNGTDPRQRIEFQEVMGRLGSQGRTILVSSHILEEVETLAYRILLMVSGKLAAAGDFRAIRAKLDDQAYRVRILVDAPRLMASAIVALDDVDSVSLEGDGALVVHTRKVATIQGRLARLAQQNGIRLTRMEAIDESLDSLFQYIVER